MDTRHLIILAAVAVVLTGAVVAFGVLENRQEVTLKQGSYLLPGFNPEKVYGIYVKQGDESLTFKRLDEAFHPHGKYDYPSRTIRSTDRRPSPTSAAPRR
jgi:hypothetical protein